MISSRHNSHIKALKRYATDASARYEDSVYILEHPKAIADLLSSNPVLITALYHSSEQSLDSIFPEFTGQLSTLESSIFACDPAVFSTISTVPNPQGCLLYTSPSPRDLSTSRMPSSA